MSTPNSFTICSDDPEGNQFETTLFVADGNFIVTQVLIDNDPSEQSETHRICLFAGEGGADISDILRKLADQLELGEV